ncbi:hypothetical protein [Candidatus Pristimantibacillus sp. PTI5]|uniref:hypothetical protein n=1 Tax=Candidatus Pristimantibacillus sp. PTI5 TaxID=3400422 RepID=UPI003B01C17B
MEAFKQALDELIGSMIRLEQEWEKIEEGSSDELAVQYPLDDDFRTVVHRFIEWRNKL